MYKDAQDDREMTDAEKLEFRRRLLQLLGTAGSAGLGYMGSRYILGIKDTPINLLAGGLGGVAGYTGMSFLQKVKEQQEEHEETSNEHRLEQIKKTAPKSILGYHTRPRSLAIKSLGFVAPSLWEAGSRLRHGGGKGLAKWIDTQPPPAGQPAAGRIMSSRKRKMGKRGILAGIGLLLATGLDEVFRQGIALPTLYPDEQ